MQFVLLYILNKIIRLFLLGVTTFAFIVHWSFLFLFILTVRVWAFWKYLQKGGKYWP